jgi:phosphoribosyl-AMP cyclohydrolase
MEIENENWLDEINWNEEGLVPAIAQDQKTGKVLTLAWMNREALLKCASENTATYWSRSRQALWTKGEQSGHTQRIREIRTDCDKDAVLLIVEQKAGIACHTGRYRCFYSLLDKTGWKIVEPVIKDPQEIYKSKA